MQNLKKSLLILILISSLFAAFLQIAKNTYSQDYRFCCDNSFPPYSHDPSNTMTLGCEKEETITAETCARYWSAYGEEHVNELCDALPNPPLPPIPVPANFNVSNNNNQPEITWDDYYVHWYDIYRKIDDGSWSHVQRITTYSTDSWTDESADISNHCYCYKMRGSVYDAFSNYTSVKTIGVFTGSMSGPSSLGVLENGTFTANPSACGTSPFDYTWYKMQLGIDKGGDEPKGPPTGQWVHLPYYDGSQTAVASGLAPGFKMRVVIEDDEDETLTIDKTITVSGGGLGKSIAENSSNSELENNNQKVYTFKLLPNYPNPFNPETTIRYQLAEESHVSLVIFNLLGEEIKHLVNEKQLTGRYSIQWDGCDGYGNHVCDGIYIYKFEAISSSGDATSRFFDTKKMIMIR